ncbi:MAG: hypothetical protein CSA05_00525 [Bacteroidia bacterium]|nr:MAG: hypothetical protein CSA05_00525 [Bacteroidia bacterium]
MKINLDYFVSLQPPKVSKTFGGCKKSSLDYPALTREHAPLLEPINYKQKKICQINLANLKHIKIFRPDNRLKNSSKHFKHMALSLRHILLVETIFFSVSRPIFNLKNKITVKYNIDTNNKKCCVE